MTLIPYVAYFFSQKCLLSLTFENFFKLKDLLSPLEIDNDFHLSPQMILPIITICPT